MLVRLFLALIAIMFLCFGLWSISDPLGMTRRLDVAVTGPNAAFEMRGIFGGVSLGMAAMSAAGAINPIRFKRPALYALIVYMGGYTLARLVSLILGDSATASGWSFAGFEAACFLLACLALRIRRGKTS